MKFKVLYCLYVVVCILYPSIYIIGGISIRHIFSIVMIVLCFAEGEVKLDKFLKWYLLFLFFYAVSCFVTGYVQVLFARLFGTYFACITMYLSTKTMITKYQAGNWIIITLISVAVLNSVVAIGQFYGSSLAQTIPYIMRINLQEETLEFYERYDDFHGLNVGGLLDTVTSGYFLSGVGILALYNSKGKINLVNWSIFIFIYFALFLVQERAGLYFGIMCVSIYLMLAFKNSRRNSLLLFSGVIILLLSIVYLGNYFIDVDKMRYFNMGVEDNLRENLMKNGWNYFMENLMGGITAFHAAGNRDPHTILVNAFLFGGIFGGIILLGIIFSHLVTMARVLIEFYNKRKNYSLFLLVTGIAYMDYTLNCFVHNASLASGDSMFFLLLGAFIASLELGKKQSTQKKIQYKA